MQPAYDDAVALLSRRPLTERELAARLAERGHDPAAIDGAVERLIATGVIDDAALARDWIATRAASRGRGRDRAIAELAARGVRPEVAAAAWRSAIDDGDLDEGDALARAVRRRLGASPAAADSGRIARVYNALLREGFEPTAIEEALRPYGFEGIEP